MGVQLSLEPDPRMMNTGDVTSLDSSRARSRSPALLRRRPYFLPHGSALGDLDDGEIRDASVRIECAGVSVPQLRAVAAELGGFAWKKADDIAASMLARAAGVGSRVARLEHAAGGATVPPSCSQVVSDREELASGLSKGSTQPRAMNQEELPTGSSECSRPPLIAPIDVEKSSAMTVTVINSFDSKVLCVASVDISTLGKLFRHHPNSLGLQRKKTTWGFVIPQLLYEHRPVDLRRSPAEQGFLTHSTLVCDSIEVTHIDLFWVVTLFCDREELSSRDSLIWQYVDDLTIRHLASDSYTMQRESLPCGLRRLRLGEAFDQRFDHLVIPSCV